jgi:hypothetical protein
MAEIVAHAQIQIKTLDRAEALANSLLCDKTDGVNLLLLKDRKTGVLKEIC